MAEMQWYAATDSGRFDGTAAITSRSCAVCLRAELPAGVLQNAVAALPWTMAHEEKIFMNGYQTWTACPELDKWDRQHGVERVPKFLLEKYSFDRYGDYHFVPYSGKRGQSHGFSYCYFRRGKTYRLLASLDETPGSLFFAEGTEDEVFDAWFAALGCRPRTTRRLAGYSSWYNRYQNIDEASIREDLNGCKTLFRAGDLFQIDDGWERKVGDWLEPDPAKFPNGLRPLADAAHESGFLAGLWLAPFVCEKESLLCKNHPDWLLQVDGQPWCCGCNWSSFYALDIDHPEVQAYLKQVFDRVLQDWGFDLVKLDFLYGAAPFGNARESRAGRMQRAMALLRSWCGDKLILGCGVPVMPAFGIVDYCRIGCDVGLDWDDVWYMRLFHRERVSTKQSIGNTIFRRQLNGRAYGSDPDVFFLREENCKLTAQQKQTLARVNALFSGILLTSDMPSRYTDEMRRQYNALRELTDHAENCTVDADDGLTVHYTLHGQQQAIKVF